MISRAPIDIVIAAEVRRTTARYGQRAIRYVHMEAGHAGQNVSLQAIALGLGTVMIGAFDDGEVKEVLGIREEPLYIIPVGRM
jgi:SagB-type dehydrogenase family enzyme